MQEYKYSLTEIERMVPYERSIYVDLLHEWIEKERERIKKQHMNDAGLMSDST